MKPRVKYDRLFLVKREDRLTNNLEIITENEKETQKVGKILIEEILKEGPRKKAMVVGLEGELGSGKTTFVKGMTKGLMIKERITSPTFVILKKYSIPNVILSVSEESRGKESNLRDPSASLQDDIALRGFYHIDCYRLLGSKDLTDLDFKEIINNPENVVAIEWAKRVKRILPKNSLWIRLKHLGQNKRKITII